MRVIVSVLEQLDSFKVKFMVKIAVCLKRKTLVYGEFDCQFDFDSHEWGFLL